MAEVANMPAAAPAIADKPPPPTTTTTTTLESSQQNESFDDDKSAPIVKDARLNSHHHDSEYDTASDDGGDDDDYEDDDDDSLGADGEEDESENGSVGFDLERERGDGQEQDFLKKVDEDRSNPQYIPKKGNFYEHDDRTLEEGELGVVTTEEGGEGEQTKSSTPSISQSSKTMKKWQPASAVERWSHDRFDESEQAPKSRQELVSAYGYDIRSEEGPPRPRRRRRYGRGPNKYNRNWEDESAYIKTNNNNPQRKPRPEDFPELGDRERRSFKSRSFREEKENRYDRDSERTSTAFNRGTNLSQRDGRIEKRNNAKSFKSGRQSFEFRNQNRNRIVAHNNDTQSPTVSSTSTPGRKTDNRDDVRNNDTTRTQSDNVVTNNFTNNRNARGPQKPQSDRIMNNQQLDVKKFNQAPNVSGAEKTDKMQVISTTIHNSPAGLNTNRPQSTLSARLQVHNRNDPSHVGSIQMHSIMAQTQMDESPQPPQQQQQQPGPAVAETSRTKRYSSLRQRSQNDTVPVPTGPQPTIVDQHTLVQQLQLHDHHSAHPAAHQHVLLQDQHLLQSNIMQLYQTQENLQAQMQGVNLQGLTGAGHQQKTPYQNVQAPSYQASPPAPTYYNPTAEYTQPTPVAAQYSQQQAAAAAAYIQPQPAAANPLASYTQPPPQASGAAPSALGYVQPPGPTGTAPYQNFTGYQNYNTVGGTTYFVPQPPATSRPVALPQRRPTNAIPILAPPNEKQKSRTDKDEEAKKGGAATTSSAPLGSAENIDHILDNMFVQRPPLQPPTRKSSSPSNESTGTTSTTNDEKSQTVAGQTTGTTAENSTNDANRLEDAVKNMTLTDDKKPIAVDHQLPANNSVSGAATTTLHEQQLTTTAANTSETG